MVASKSVAADEVLVPLTKLLAYLPGVASRSKLYKWADPSIGCGVRGQRFVLETSDVGGRLYSSKAMLDRFLAACSAARGTQRTRSKSPAKNSKKRTTHTDAARELARAGA